MFPMIGKSPTGFFQCLEKSAQKFSNVWKNYRKKFPMFGKTGAKVFQCLENFAPRFSNVWKTSGWSLLELLVAVAMLGVLAMLFAAAARSLRDAAHRAQCASNLRQLYLANAAYAAETGYYVAAAPDIIGPNRQRWHGTRAAATGAFDPSRGPLARYIGAEGVRRCPAFPVPHRGPEAFEARCGGYGYNDRGVGSQVYRLGYRPEAMQRGMRPSEIRQPAATVMFADTAFGQPYGAPRYFIEYSFAEAYYFVGDRPDQLYGPASPSIHFRHGGRAGVVWCDGHVTFEPQTLGNFKLRLGWFGPPDNSLFDPF